MRNLFRKKLSLEVGQTVSGEIISPVSSMEYHGETYTAAQIRLCGGYKLVAAFDNVAFVKGDKFIGEAGYAMTDIKTGRILRVLNARKFK